MDGIREIAPAASVVVLSPTWFVQDRVQATMLPPFGVATRTRLSMRRAPAHVTGPPDEGSSPP
jgi:hypothetical protein